MKLNKVKEFENSIEKVNGVYKWKNYILPIKLFESSVFYYRHGLDRLKNKKYIENKTILDCGGYIADSALIFRDEFPNSKIISFEPLKRNYELAKNTLELNNVKNIVLENLGLSDKNEILKMKTYDTDLKNIESSIRDDGDEIVKVTTIDDYVKKHKLKVGLIKTDVEGYEQKLLKGAKEVILKQKPTLLISIYHTYEDFYKIKPMLESWNLGYTFDILQGIQNSGDIAVETLLLAEMKGE